MRSEAIHNAANLQWGWASKYDESATFVYKLFPIVKRETKEKFMSRFSANSAPGARSGWLTRDEFPPGSPGYFFLQAKVLMAGVQGSPRHLSAAPFSEVDIHDDGSATVHMPIDGIEEDPQYRSYGMAQILGSTMTGALMSAFACELAMKAIRLTRLDDARKTHDLLALYRDLPEDGRIRIETDYPEIESVLRKARHAFGKWRYFETNIASTAIAAMADTDQALALGKAARVIIDEAEIAGLDGEVKLNANQHVTIHDEKRNYKYTHQFTITGRESSRPTKTNVRRPSH